MRARSITRTLQDRLARYPAVALVGPRQSGKTTLARALSETYFDLEQENERVRLDLRWKEVLAGDELIVLDEAQAWPEVFTRLRGAIDEDRQRNGRVLLLGSISPSLMTQVSESLAGRLSLVELTPFLLTELPDLPLERTWLYGGYPDGGVLDPGQFSRWQTDYLALLSHRDLPSWGMPARPQVIDRLLKMLGAVHGQIWNASQLGQSLGLSHNTVNSYVDYLEGAFLVRRLPSYQANLRKRLVKSPKCYWRDSGLLHSLLRVTDFDHLLSQPWVGASWEGFVIEQILGALEAYDQQVDPFFFRTSDQYEIDLVLVRPKEIWAIEIKLTSQPQTSDLARLNKAADMIGADKRVLVSQTARSAASDNVLSCSLPELLRSLGRRGG